MSKEITGWFKRDIFHNPDNDYHVGKIEVLKTNVDIKEINRYKSDDGYITIVGYLPQLLKDDLYHFYGEFKKNNYGIQFSVESYEMEEKKDEESLILFLSSDLFKGIGKKTARRIVTELGSDAIDKIIKDKSILDTIDGLGENTKNLIYEVLLVNYESEKMMRFLLKNGFGNRLAKKIFKKYKENTISYIEENPYRLIDEIEGIGFKKADSLALSLDFDLKSPNRIQAAIKYIFEEFCFSEGFTYITYEQLITKAKYFLNEKQIALTDDEIDENITVLINKNRLIVTDEKYYLPVLYHAELTIAHKINELLKNEAKKVNKNEIDKVIEELEDEMTIHYTDEQKLAIKEALLSPVTIITGGPGTGKTTIVNGFLKTYIKLHKIKKNTAQIALVAPTGRAAKRMQETTSFDASTIHRLLGYQITGEFTYDENNRLECELIIVDESSMVDVLLCANLLKALPHDVQIVFVGDINQLPSVGPGEVLKDLIQSEKVTTVKLEKIHRQGQDSSIIRLAHDINHKIISNDLLTKQKDRNFIRSNKSTILNHLDFILTNALDKKFSIDNVQVLAPMYKGEVGIDRINEHLQECLNPKTEDKKEIHHFNRIFRMGDKVIQLVNKPEENVMNGDIGYIKHVFLEKENDDDTKLIVDFEGQEVYYTESDLNDISLAYCISIHKSQGSEFDVVVLVLSKSYYIMLRKKLLYTAITRAKKSLIMIGDVEAYHLAVNNTREKVRQTSLRERLLMLNSDKLTIDGYTFSYSPQQNKTPYDFLS